MKIFKNTIYILCGLVLGWAGFAFAVTALFPQQGGTGNSITPAKGTVLVSSTTSFQPLLIGSNGQALVADSAEVWGVKWGAPTGDGTSNFSWYDANTLTPSSTKGLLVQTTATATNLTVTSISGLVKCNGEANCAAGVSGTDFDTAAAWNTNANASTTAVFESKTQTLTNKSINPANNTITAAVADGATQGVATFTAADFNASSGNISLDYSNGQAATAAQDGFLQSTDFVDFAITVTSSINSSSTVPQILDGGFTGLAKIVAGKVLQAAVATTDYLTQASNAVLTGSWDFGGATSLEVPNGTAPTVDAAGEIAVDTTADQLKYYTSRINVLSPTSSRGFAILTPAASGSVPIWKVPYDVTVGGVHCITGTSGSTATIDLYEGGSTGATTSTMLNAAVVCDYDGQAAVVTNGTLDASDWMGYMITAVASSPASVAVTLWYYVDSK